MLNYTIRIHTCLSELSEPAWDALVRASHNGELHPCLRYAYLNAMEQSNSATAETGWGPCHLSLLDDDVLVAATPLYLKSHSYGEFVFDWAWADAYQRNGLEYFPKLLSAIPFTPVFGQRLLAANQEARRALFEALVQLSQQASQSTELFGTSVSSWHGLFLGDDDLAAAKNHACLVRKGVQFHWKNISPATEKPYRDFEEFLEQLTQKKRKNIRAERRKVEDANVTVRVLTGQQASDEDWDFFYLCYCTTYAQHHSSPYLTRKFFDLLRSTMPEQLLLSIAIKGHATNGERVASSLCLMSENTLYGRYWGTIEYIPCLHFETAYYAPLNWAIEHGISTFEGGAQGEHKMARGFVPVESTSLHWLAHPGFYDAVDRFLAREGQGISAYLDELTEHLPFKTP